MELLGFIGGVATLQGYASNIKRLYLFYPKLELSSFLVYVFLCLFMCLYSIQECTYRRKIKIWDAYESRPSRNRKAKYVTLLMPVNLRPCIVSLLLCLGGLGQANTIFGDVSGIWFLF